MQPQHRSPLSPESAAALSRLDERSPVTGHLSCLAQVFSIVSRRPNRARAAVADEQVDLVEFPSVSLKNLVQLGVDVLRASSIPATVANSPTTTEDLPYLSSISNLISGNKTFPEDLPIEETTAWLSPAEVEALAETFRKVYPSIIQVLSQSLTRLMVRRYLLYLLDHGTFPGWIYRLDFTPIPSSVNPKSSPA